MDDAYPTTKLDLIARINETVAELDGVVGPLPDARLDAPGPDGGWSIKDHLYHLGAWRLKQVAQLRGESIPAALGVDDAVYNGHDVDAINAVIQARSSALSASEARDYFGAAHRAILAAIGDFPEADLAGPGYPDEPDGAPMVAYVAGNTYEHDAEHLGYIRAILRS